MSTRFENKIIMPRGHLGPTTLLCLPPQEIQSVERWHRREWDKFRNELVAFKARVHTAYYDFLHFNREHCIACRMGRRFSSRRMQRGSILLSAFGLPYGTGDCTFTASTIPNLSDFEIEPTNAYTRARLHSDGDWYSNTTNAWGTSDGTWQGGCAIADYDTRWNLVSGTAPNDAVSGTDGVWSAATTSKAVGYARTSFGLTSGSFSLEARDGTTLNVLFTDSFTMSANVDSKN